MPRSRTSALPRLLFLYGAMGALALASPACKPELFRDSLFSASPTPSPSASPSVIVASATAASITTAEDTPVTSSAVASITGSSTLTYSTVTPPAKGSVSWSSSTPGQFTYTPSLNLNGTDSFTFQATDGVTNSPAATVSVTISPVDDAPVASAATITLVEDSVGNVITFAYSDVESDAATTCSAAATAANNLTLAAACGCTSGVCTASFTPRANVSGNSFATITFTVNANAQTSAQATATVDVTPFCVANTGTTYNQFGAGTAASPHKLCTKAQIVDLQAAGAAALTKSYLQKQNIDLTGYNAVIGSNTLTFTGGPSGYYDGGGYQLQNFTYSNNTLTYVGLFAQSTATIKNASLVNATVTGGVFTGGFVGRATGGGIVSSSFIGSISGAQYTGGLAGYATGVSFASNAITAAVVSSAGDVGGMAGYVASTTIVTNSSSTGLVKGGGSYIGGLIGRAVSATNGGNSSSASVTDTAPSTAYVAGLIGYADASPVSSSFATGAVNLISLAAGAGGLVGYALNGSTITSSYATGNVTTNYGGTTGGLVGNCTTNSHISNSYALGDVNTAPTDLTNTWAAVVGGLVGTLNSCNLTNVSARGNVTGGNDGIGGLVGSTTSATLTNVFARGSVVGYKDVGALVGLATTTTFVDCYATGNASTKIVDGFSRRVGGLVGQMVNSTITRCHASGSVFIGDSAAGGLVGQASGTPNSITDSYSTGNMSGGYYMGGFIGSASNITITGSFSTGNVVGSTWRSGGFIGYAGTSAISNSYSSGSVISASGAFAGGFVGYSDGTVFSNDYATGNSHVTGALTDNGGFAGYANNSVFNYVFGSGLITGGGATKGGVVGNAAGTLTIAKAFYNGSLNVAPTVPIGNAADANAISMSTAQLQSEATFTSAGFDFVGETTNGTNDYWVMPQTTGYPKLKAIYPCYGTALTDAPYANSASAPAGTRSAPLIICTPTQMAAISSNSADWSKWFRLADNINMTTNLTPIGNSTTSFSGTFDGRDNTISNVTLAAASTDSVGVFGRVYGHSTAVPGDGTSDGHIFNLKLANVNVTGGQRTGALVGLLGSGHVAHVRVLSGTVTGTSKVGGIVGQTLGDSTNNPYGGISGHGTSINDAYNWASVSASTDTAGGVAGDHAGSLYASMSMGNVSGASSGGFVGTNVGTVQDSYANPTSVSGANTGGFVGANSGTVARSYSAGAIPGFTPSNSGTVNACFYDSTLATSGSVAGTATVTATMKTSANYTGNGWHVGQIFRYPASDYPRLRGE